MTDVTGQEATGESGADNVLGRLGQMLRRGDIALALGVVCILAVLILPMPSWMLDISLAMSMTLSVLILMTVLFISRALDFSSFPTVAISRTVGKELNSKGLPMNSTVIRISTEKAMETASERSSIQLGIGRMRTTRIAVTPSARATSPRLSMLKALAS